MVDRKTVLASVAVAGALGAIGYVLYTKNVLSFASGANVVKITVVNNCNVPATLCGTTQDNKNYSCYTINAGSTTTFNLIKGSQFILALTNAVIPSNLNVKDYALQDKTINLCGCVSQDVILPQCG